MIDFTANHTTRRNKKKVDVAQAAVEGAANGGGIGIGAGYLVRKSRGTRMSTLATSLRREKAGFLIGSTLGGVGYGINEYKNQFPTPKLKKPRIIKPKTIRAGGTTRNAS